MMLDQSPRIQEVPAEQDKQHAERCRSDRSTQFYWNARGLEYRCRHCKGVYLVPWEEILQHYRELVGITI